MYPVPENPKISVVIPALNEEKLIGRTLKNVHNVVPEAEIIVVDGGSNDKTVEIAKKYAKICLTDGTIATARNTGAEATVGDIIIFLDADTSINKKFVDEATKAFKNPNIVGVGGMIMPNCTSALAEAVFYFFNFLIMVSSIFRRPVLAGTCVAYKRKPFFEVGGFNAKMVASEDFDLCKKISKKGKVVFLRNIIVRTSRRRLKKLGLIGLISDWSRVTVQFLLGKIPKEYRTFR